MSLPAERFDDMPEPATEQVITFDDGPDLSADGFADDAKRADEAERLGRTLEQ